MAPVKKKAAVKKAPEAKVEAPEAKVEEEAPVAPAPAPTKAPTQKDLLNAQKTISQNL